MRALWVDLREDAGGIGWREGVKEAVNTSYDAGGRGDGAGGLVSLFRGGDVGGIFAEREPAQRQPLGIERGVTLWSAGKQFSRLMQRRGECGAGGLPVSLAQRHDA